jgi:phosphoglycolate phosphatase
MLFIFDWDGTLLDSTAKIVRCMQQAIGQMELPDRDGAEVKNIIGLALPEAVEVLFPGLEAASSKQLIAFYSQCFVEADQVPCHFYPGVERVLGQLREEGHQLTVATGKSRRGLNRVLNNLGLVDFFDASRCADETASKPSPLMLHQLLAELEVNAADAVMVGDTVYDLEMAANAGIKSVGVSYGAHSSERLLEHNPVLLIDSFEQLLSLQGLRAES